MVCDRVVEMDHRRRCIQKTWWGKMRFEKVRKETGVQETITEKLLKGKLKWYWHLRRMPLGR